MGHARVVGSLGGKCCIIRRCIEEGRTGEVVEDCQAFSRRTTRGRRNKLNQYWYECLPFAEHLLVIAIQPRLVVALSGLPCCTGTPPRWYAASRSCVLCSWRVRFQSNERHPPHIQTNLFTVWFHSEVITFELPRECMGLYGMFR